MWTPQLKRRLLAGIGLAVLVFIGLLFYGDVKKISRLLTDFEWRLIPLVFGLTVVNYALRGVRFHYYLRQIGVANISLWTSMRVFIGGFALTLTPGKVGELVRIFWLKNIANADPARVAPSIIVDRIVDGLAMAILAMLGIVAYPRLWPVVASIMAMLLAGVIIIQIRPLALWFLALGERLPLVARIAHHLHALYESAYTLLRLKNLLFGLVIGLLAWTAEGIAFYFVLVGLGVPPAAELVLLAISTLAVGSLVGGASSLPGGLGATEVSMTGILQAVVGLPSQVAATATLMIRFFTLWSGVGLGVLIVIIWRKMLFGSSNLADATTAVAPPGSDATHIGA
ncbi:MAG: lysylphosphatidylglycerol synthase transmembrane domain-containing protein [Anaerolineae bacterium]